MPQFQCRVGTPRGQITTRTVYAESPEQARKELQKQGFWVFDVRQRRSLGDWLRLLLGLQRRRLSHRRFLVFNQELATLLRAGLPIVHSLTILEERQRDPALRFIIGAVRERVKAGASLSEAFEDFAGQVPRLYIANLHAGERSGQIEAVLRRYVRYSEMFYNLKRQIMSSLTYPLILLVLASLLLMVLFLYVIPRFVDFYSGLEADLPLITVLVIGVARRVRYLLPAALLVAGMAFLGLRLLMYLRPMFERAVHRLFLRAGVFGRIGFHYGLSQFAHTLATLLQGGMPLVHALEVAASSVWNREIQSRIREARNRVREGSSLHQALEDAGLDEDLLLEMVRVGESTGALGEMLEYAGRFYDDDVATTMNRVMALIEPALLVVMGMIVLIVLISVYYPIFSLASRVRV